MLARHIILAGQYRDSVSLMRLSSVLSGREGARQVSAVMASPNNLALLREAGLLREDPQAGPNDLIIAVQADSEDAAKAVLDEARELLTAETPDREKGERAKAAPRSLGMGIKVMPGANLALISTPGEWAAHEAAKALRLGLHVMIFSDNVPVEQEAALKRYAEKRDLLVMGPDCGTAILSGVPLAFANVVRRGCIGVAGASGTGIQQITSLVDRFGMGISQAIGTGGHDLSREVGGITMLQAIRALSEDPETKVIVLVSKPPAPEVAGKVLREASMSGKPVVVNFIGNEGNLPNFPGIQSARTLEDAAMHAVLLAGGRAPEQGDPLFEGETRFSPEQHRLRGLYSGGTFCCEATMLLDGLIGDLHSNTPVRDGQELKNPWKSEGNTLVDMGDDVFTRGRPHPMIDPSLRLARLREEARDPETAVILFDVVIGRGAHPDPAGELARAVIEARREAEAEGRDPAFVGFVCGTDADPQGLKAQEQKLKDAGVALETSNARAVRMAAGILRNRVSRQRG